VSRPLGPDRPFPARTQPLPRRVEDITAEALTELLRLRHPGVTVRALEPVEVKSSHTSKLRLRLDLDDAGRAAGIPEMVCLKANLSGLRTGLICEREARFYDLARQGLGLPIPRSWFADWDDDGRGNGLVVMEDLGEASGAFGTSTDHLGVDGVAHGLASLARVHGAFWGDPRLTSAAWIPGSMATDNDTEQVVEYWEFIHFNLGSDAYREVVPEWVLQAPEKMQHALDELSAYERGLTGPQALVHGDAHQGNTFLRADGERVWLDWQLVRRGSPWRDVSYFMVSSLTVDERRGHERALVEHYREHLIATGAEGVPSTEQTWEHLRRWPAYGTQAWLGNINQWGQHGGVEMVRRQFAAAEDYDTLALLTDGTRPRDWVPGEGAFRLPKGLSH
jgi:hypothetical protein